MLYEIISGMTYRLFEKDAEGEQEPCQTLKYIQEKIFKMCSIISQREIFISGTE